MNSFPSHHLGNLLSKCLSHSFENLGGYKWDYFLSDINLHSVPEWQPPLSVGDSWLLSPSCIKKKKQKQLCRGSEEIGFKISVCREQTVWDK